MPLSLQSISDAMTCIEFVFLTLHTKYRRRRSRLGHRPADPSDEQNERQGAAETWTSFSSCSSPIIVVDNHSKYVVRGREVDRQLFQPVKPLQLST